MSGEDDFVDVEAWRCACELGERILREAMEPRIKRRLDRGARGVDIVPMFAGAATEAARAIAAMTDPAFVRGAEESLIAHIRGTMRDLDGPVNEDGSKYGDW